MRTLVQPAMLDVGPELYRYSRSERSAHTCSLSVVTVPAEPGACACVHIMATPASTAG